MLKLIILGLGLLCFYFAGCGFISYSINGTIPYILMVADPTNGRVLIWKSAPKFNDQPADIVLGQADFASVSSSPDARTLVFPRGVASDGQRIFVADYNASRVLVWNNIPTSNYAPADLVLGQPDFTSSSANAGLGAPTAQTLNLGPEGVHVSSGKLFVGDESNKRMLIWNSLPTTNFQAADLEVGEINMTVNGGGTTASLMQVVSSPFHDGTRTFCCEFNLNHRCLIWNSPIISNGQPADVVIGQTTMGGNAANGPGVVTGLSAPHGIFSDGTHLIISDRGNNRVLIWNSIPTTNGKQADIVLGQPDFTTVTSNTGGVSASSMSLPTRIFYDGTRLYVSEHNNNRVLIWNSLPTRNQQPADLVLGQPDFTSVSANQGASTPSARTLNTPYSIWTNAGWPGVRRAQGY
jgi:hypothetical protein